MTLPARAAFLAIVCEILLSPCLFIWPQALPLTHMPGFFLIWDREPLFDVSAGGYAVMVLANLAVLFVAWILVLFLLRGVCFFFRRARRHPSTIE
ncbi:MAG: hypothetical protein JWL59_3305 [Chthoniobacteraceae bacterium]|nr:hypothetical protein [Chthoniobacteraceae bacterium]